MSEWADAERELSPESSATHGRWRTDRAEYLRGILDAFSDPTIHTVVVMSSAQVGKTEALNNVVGYFISQDPSPTQCVFPTLELAIAWSKDRLAPMLRDTPALHGKVADAKSRTAENRILHKVFPGGHITVSGANSPVSLRSRPIRIVLCDDVDGFPASAGSEGDPVSLAWKRATTFWNKKLGLFSTPTLRGESRIERAYLGSDRRIFLVPCPSCGHCQRLVWAQVKPLRDGGAWPETASYHCEAQDCDARWTDAQLNKAVRKGGWVATKPFNGVAGFHLNELLSPWVKLRETAAAQIEAKHGGREELKAWTNTALGETWADDGSKERDPDALYYRREVYPAEVPAPVVLLTAAVDVQDDRLELEVIGHNGSRGTYGVRNQVIYGSPAEPATWAQLQDVLEREWKHESGLSLRIVATGIDTHGHHTIETYRFIRAMQRRRKRVYALRGGGTREPISVPSRNNVARVALFTINVNVFKARVFDALDNTDERSPAYWHFPKNARGDSDAYGLEFFEQLCSEVKRIRYVRGVAHESYEKIRERNEALDLRVYNLVALEILKPDWPAVIAKHRARLVRFTGEQLRELARHAAVEAQARALADDDDAGDDDEGALEQRAEQQLEQRAAARRREREIEQQIRDRRRPKRRGGWVHGWRRH